MSGRSGPRRPSGGGAWPSRRRRRRGRAARRGSGCGGPTARAGRARAARPRCRCARTAPGTTTGARACVARGADDRRVEPALACDWSCASPRSAASRIVSTSSASRSSSLSVIRSAREPRRERLERRPHRERLQQLLGRERAHRAAAERLVDDAAELLEVAQRLAHRRLRDAELLRDPRLDQAGAGRVLAARMRCRITSLICSRRFERMNGAVGHWHAVSPPSSVSTCPVMNADASLHSSRTAPITSSVSAIRPSGMRL